MIPPLPWKVGNPYRRRFVCTEPRIGIYTSPEFDNLPVGDCPNCAEFGKPVSTYKRQGSPGEGRIVHAHFDESLNANGPFADAATITAADGSFVLRVNSDEAPTLEQIEIAQAIVAAMSRP